jgi:hypothetical protein
MDLDNGTILNVDRLVTSADLSAAGISRADLSMLTELFTHATTFGSLIEVPDLLAERLPALSQSAEQSSQDLFSAGDLQQLRKLVRQATILTYRYDAVVANPPYMGSKGMNPVVKEFAKTTFPDAKGDLFACFIERGYMLAKIVGHVAMVTMESWMFLSSYENFRSKIISRCTLRNLAHFPYDGKQPTAMAINFGISVITLKNKPIDQYRGHFCCTRYFELSATGQPHAFPTVNERLAIVSTDDFKKIPGSPIAYWAPRDAITAFDNGKALGEIVDARIALATGDNAKFVRAWTEVPLGHIGFGINSNDESVKSGAKWFPANKGGDFRKWYGNNDNLVNWLNDGVEVRALVEESTGRVRSHNYNGSFGFKESVTWSALSSSRLGVRYSPPGFMFVTPGSSVFRKSETTDLKLVLALLASNVADYFLHLISATMNIEVGNILRIPYFSPPAHVADVARSAIERTKSDWDAYERSWEFQSLPVLKTFSESTPTLESSYKVWITLNKRTIAEMKRLEEENNRLFIDAYGLTDEITPDVPLEQITLTVNPAYRYGGDGGEDEKWTRFRRDTMAEFLSYATGCMMGRYSLDQPGLILADSRDTQAAHLAAYGEKIGKPLDQVQFKPDADGIIPVLDGEWFEDDIVARTREFLEVTFPESTVTENLRFIEESLGKDIRKYFCSEFYKDHLQTYKKRPIYWLVQSPKKGFACLIYLHRYTKDTLNQVLNNYFRPYLQKLEAHLAQLGLDQLNDSLPTRERTAARKEAEKITKVLKECEAWEQDALLPLAQQRIELDLDDGVKVNYLKLQDVLATIPGLAAKED